MPGKGSERLGRHLCEQTERSPPSLHTSQRLHEQAAHLLVPYSKGKTRLLRLKSFRLLTSLPYKELA